MHRRLILILPLGAIAVFLASLPAARAADADLARFKAAIDGFVAQLGPATNGALEWMGSDPYAPHRAGGKQHRLLVNGSDLDAWFGQPQAAAGGKRLLKPADPPLRGEDAKEIEKALGGTPIDGVYRPGIAAAVARFQKAHGLNADGVADAATRRALGLKN